MTDSTIPRTSLSFSIPGEAVGKGRPRATSIGGHTRMYTPAKTANYEGLVAYACAEAMAGSPPMSEPVSAHVEIICSVPASWSKKKTADALSGKIRPAKKPDADNVVKSVFDGMNGVAWIDDVQAVEGGWKKRYGTTPGVHVRIETLS